MKFYDRVAANNPNVLYPYQDIGGADIMSGKNATFVAFSTPTIAFGKGISTGGTNIGAVKDVQQAYGAPKSILLNDESEMRYNSPSYPIKSWSVKNTGKPLVVEFCIKSYRESSAAIFESYKTSAVKYGVTTVDSDIIYVDDVLDIHPGQLVIGAGIDDDTYVTGTIVSEGHSYITVSSKIKVSLSQNILFQTNVNSGVYIENGSLLLRLSGYNMRGEIVKKVVSYQLPDSKSHHIVVYTTGSSVYFYVDGKLVLDRDVQFPDRYPNITGYRTRGISGESFLSSLAVYNSDKNIDSIVNVFSYKNNDILIPESMYSAYSDSFIINNRMQYRDHISIPENNSWLICNTSNCNVGLTVSPVEAKNIKVMDGSRLSVTSNGYYASSGLDMSDFSANYNGNFAVTSRFAFSPSPTTTTLIRTVYYLIGSNGTRLHVYRKTDADSDYLYLELYNGSKVVSSSSYDASALADEVWHDMCLYLLSEGAFFDVDGTNVMSIENASPYLSRSNLYIGGYDGSQSNAYVKNIKITNDVEEFDSTIFANQTTDIDHIVADLTVDDRVLSYGYVTYVFSSPYSNENGTSNEFTGGSVSWGADSSYIRAYLDVDGGGFNEIYNYSKPTEWSGAIGDRNTFKFKLYSDNKGNIGSLSFLKISLYVTDFFPSDVSGDVIVVDGSGFSIAEKNSHYNELYEDFGYSTGNAVTKFQPTNDNDILNNNPNMFSLSGWTLTTGTHSIVLDSDATNGYAAKLDTATPFDFTSDKIYVVPGASYVASANIKNSNAVSSNVYIIWYTEGDAVISSTAATANAGKTFSIIQKEAVAPATAAYAKIRLTASPATPVFVDYFTLKEGTEVQGGSLYQVSTRHTYRSISMTLKPSAVFSPGNIQTLLDYFDGTNRYRLWYDSELHWDGFDSVYVNGQSVSSYVIEKAGVTNIVANINNHAIMPSETRPLFIGRNYSELEPAEFDFKTISLSYDHIDAAKNYNEIFSPETLSVADQSLGASIVGQDSVDVLSATWSTIGISTVR